MISNKKHRILLLLLIFGLVLPAVCDYKTTVTQLDQKVQEKQTNAQTKAALLQSLGQ